EHAEGTASLADYGISAERDFLLGEIATAFSDYFGVLLESDTLAESEQADMIELTANRYSAESWNLEGVAE
ncbi:MAG: lipoate--protein ligase family protein, partial [Desulfuromonadaceae bacterium]